MDWPPPEVCRRRRWQRWVAALVALALAALAGATAVVSVVDADTRSASARAWVAAGGPVYPVECAQCQVLPTLAVDWRVGLVWLLTVLIAAVAVVVTRRHLRRS